MYVSPITACKAREACQCFRKSGPQKSGLWKVRSAATGHVRASGGYDCNCQGSTKSAVQDPRGVRGENAEVPLRGGSKNVENCCTLLAEAPHTHTARSQLPDTSFLFHTELLGRWELESAAPQSNGQGMGFR